MSGAGILRSAPQSGYAINGRRHEAPARLRDYAFGEVGISAISCAELRVGVENSQRVAKNLERLERFLLPFKIVPFDAKVGPHYGRIRTELRQRGVPIRANDNDLLIAAHSAPLTRGYSPMPARHWFAQARA